MLAHAINLQYLDMSEENVLNKYNVRFFKKTFNGRSFNMVSSVSEALDQFIPDYDTPVLVNDFIIFYIDEVLNGIKLKGYMISQSMIGVEISSDVCKFYDEPDHLDVLFSIRTKDLREIAEAWMSYLQNNRIEPKSDLTQIS